MNSEKLNKLHAEILRADLECTELGKKLDAHEEEGRELARKHDAIWETLDERVITIGTALAESKEKYGRGWKKDFDSHRYKFSYTIACRYIACARYPELRLVTTAIEDWAAASVELDRESDLGKSQREKRRKERKENRKSTGLDASGRAERNELNAVDFGQRQHVGECADSENRVSAAFRFLEKSIECSEQHRDLRDSWQVLATAIRGKLAYLTDTGSPFADDDTVDSGDVQPAAGNAHLADAVEECIEPLILEYASA